MINADVFDLWPSYLKWLIAVAVLLFVAIVGCWFNARVQLDQLAAASTEKINLSEAITRMKIKATTLSDSKKQLEKLNNIYNDLLGCLPTHAEIPALLKDISKKGMNNNIKFVLFKPEPEISHAFYAELPLQLSVIGNFHQLSRFISEIETMRRIVSLQDFVIKPINSENTTEKKQLQLSMTITSYRYLEENVTSSFISPVPLGLYNGGSVNDPFQAISNYTNDNPKTEPLEAFALDHLQMVGSIKKSGKSWALIRAPDGVVYPVTVGEHIGKNQAEIMSITEDTVTINERTLKTGELKQQTLRFLVK